eukprot:TRINITY_DN4023_c0_g1_i4.p1 TRINITY_DN4023_c0_g1~~TRINITY_DN4023_c0_g1_i4.p1  ORF type:complete len:1259 (+),score=339.80 TRINITY_DN4023_c0_g1_i4:62-3838(+)
MSSSSENQGIRRFFGNRNTVALSSSPDASSTNTPPHIQTSSQTSLSPSSTATATTTKPLTPSQENPSSKSGFRSWFSSPKTIDSDSSSTLTSTSSQSLATNPNTHPTSSKSAPNSSSSTPITIGHANTNTNTNSCDANQTSQSSSLSNSRRPLPPTPMETDLSRASLPSPRHTTSHMPSIPISRPPPIPSLQQHNGSAMTGSLPSSLFQANRATMQPSHIMGKSPNVQKIGHVQQRLENERIPVSTSQLSSHQNIMREITESKVLQKLREKQMQEQQQEANKSQSTSLTNLSQVSSRSESVAANLQSREDDAKVQATSSPSNENPAIDEIPRPLYRAARNSFRNTVFTSSAIPQIPLIAAPTQTQESDQSSPETPIQHINKPPISSLKAALENTPSTQIKSPISPRATQQISHPQASESGTSMNSALQEAFRKRNIVPHQESETIECRATPESTDAADSPMRRTPSGSQLAMADVSQAQQAKERAEDAMTQQCMKGSLYAWLENEEYQQDLIASWKLLPNAIAQLFSAATTNAPGTGIVTQAATIAKCCKSIVKYAQIAHGNCPDEVFKLQIEAYIESVKDCYDYIFTCANYVQSNPQDVIYRHQLMTAGKSFRQSLQRLISVGSDESESTDQNRLSKKEKALDPLIVFGEKIVDECVELSDVKGFESKWTSLSRSIANFIDAIHQRAGASSRITYRQYLTELAKELSEEQLQLLQSAKSVGSDLMSLKKFASSKNTICTIIPRVWTVSSLISMQQYAQKCCALTSEKCNQVVADFVEFASSRDQEWKDFLSPLLDVFQIVKSELENLSVAINTSAMITQVSSNIHQSSAKLVQLMFQDNSCKTSIMSTFSLRWVFAFKLKVFHLNVVIFYAACKALLLDLPKERSLFYKVAASARSLVQSMGDLMETIQLGFNQKDALLKREIAASEQSLTQTKQSGVEEIEDHRQSIVYTDTGNPQSKVKAATLNRLVEKLTPTDNQDLIFMRAFLMTYRSFTTPHELLDKLFERYDASDKSPEMKVLINLRVTNALARFMDTHGDDLDDSVVNRIEEFVNHLKSQGSSAASSAAKLELSVNKLKASKNVTIESPLSYEIPRNFSLTRVILDFEPDVIAQQLTYIDYQVFSKIKCNELLNQSWNKKSLRHNSPCVLYMITRFNAISAWVVGSVLWQEQLKERSKALTRVIQVAEALRKLNNFNCVMAILSGLSQSSIHRLRVSFEELPSKVEQTWKDLQELMSNQMSFKKYRQALSTARLPCIPYL